jgi:hypothetical protein
LGREQRQWRAGLQKPGHNALQLVAAQHFPPLPPMFAPDTTGVRIGRSAIPVMESVGRAHGLNDHFRMYETRWRSCARADCTREKYSILQNPGTNDAMTLTHAPEVPATWHPGYNRFPSSMLCTCGLVRV